MSLKKVECKILIRKNPHLISKNNQDLFLFRMKKFRNVKRLEIIFLIVKLIVLKLKIDLVVAFS